MALTPSLRCLRPLSWAVWTGAPITTLTHLPSKMSSLFIGGHNLLQLRCFKVAPKFSTTMWTMGDHCHWLHRKRKLRYTPRNPPPWFLCLELLRLSAWQLHLHQLSLVSSPFIIGGCLVSQAFAPPQLGASTTALFPSLHALERSSPIVFIKSTKDFLLYNFYIVFALSFIWELFFSLYLLSHYSTSYGYSCTISVCPRAISVLQIFPYSLLMFDSSSSCHNTCPSQNRVPIFIPLLYFSFIIRVFINSPLEKSQSPNLTSLEKSPLHKHTEPNCSLVPSSC